jgi:hypothetical protein
MRASGRSRGSPNSGAPIKTFLSVSRPEFAGHRVNPLIREESPIAGCVAGERNDEAL